jgi:hypothetical protein
MSMAKAAVFALPRFPILATFSQQPAPLQHAPVGNRRIR